MLAPFVVVEADNTVVLGVFVEPVVNGVCEVLALALTAVEGVTAMETNGEGEDELLGVFTRNDKYN